jgi:hypothetical protein
MRAILSMLIVSGMAWGQAAEQDKPESTPTLQEQSAAAAQAAPVVDPHSVVIPAGTKVPLTLKQAISTKNAREGDPVYAETSFPFVANDRMLIPAERTYRERFPALTMPSAESKAAPGS